MKEETKNWLEKAEEDLGTSEICLRFKRLNASVFFSQQAAEKALKAMQIERLGKFDKVHDLLTLAATVQAPHEIVNYCAKLTPYYTITRYPDVGLLVAKDTAKTLLGKSKMVVEWANKTLK